MNEIIIALIIIAIVITVFVIIFIGLSLKSKAYLSYRKKLLAFEEKKQRIEVDIKNDKKRFYE